ncbi:hypothetical protein WA026_015379 [Henosepilachna vigintioctopunctata]|uniref:Uncharacterized protein n=1 Tax=Henosepilachna vigintioctopunctata TaxID=420089 RepID=A0AAW1UKC1_9CUCU
MKTCINYEKVRSDLRNTNWYDCEDMGDVNCFTDSFIHKLTDTITNNTTTVNINNRKAGKESWITPFHIKSINKKNEMYKKLRRSPENAEILNEYLQHKKVLKKLIIEAKKITSRNSY